MTKEQLDAFQAYAENNVNEHGLVRVPLVTLKVFIDEARMASRPLHLCPGLIVHVKRLLGLK